MLRGITQSIARFLIKTINHKSLRFLRSLRLRAKDRKSWIKKVDPKMELDVENK